MCRRVLLKFSGVLYSIFLEVRHAEYDCNNYNGCLVCFYS